MTHTLCQIAPAGRSHFKHCHGFFFVIRQYFDHRALRALGLNGNGVSSEGKARGMPDG